MKIKLISGQFCSRCHMISPKLKEYAEKNGFSYEEKDINNASKEELGTATMLPVIRFDSEQLEFDEVLAKITS